MTPFWIGFLLGNIFMFVWLLIGLFIALALGEASRDNSRRHDKGG